MSRDLILQEQERAIEMKRDALMQSLFLLDDQHVKIAIALVYYPGDMYRAIEKSSAIKPVSMTPQQEQKIRELADSLRENVVESANTLLNYAVLKSVEVLTDALTIGTVKERLRAAELILNRVMGVPRRDEAPVENNNAANMVFITGADVSTWEKPRILDVMKKGDVIDGQD